ncbi:MAG: AraC family transcriptional regulator [Kofleriaceae bacterium]
MSDTRARLAALVARWAPREGVQASPLAGVSCIKVSRSQQFVKRHWRASFCIGVQGIKEIALEGQLFRDRDPHYIVSPLDLPVSSRVTNASAAKPFLALKLDFNAQALRDVASRFEVSEPDGNDGATRALFLGKASERMLEAAIRLCELFSTPEDGAVLAPLIVRELLFYVLKSPDGPAIRQLVRAGTHAHRIAAAVHHLQASLADAVDIDGLARAAGMSRAAFFKHFKAATAMSPLQYQKRLRLLEARRRMLEEGEGAAAAAFSVGFTSPSQFSREYSRMFGDAPLRDTAALKRTPVSIAQ